MKSLSSYIVIPARLRSTRLERKLLLADTGKPVIQHTYESACRAVRAAGICVAADDLEIVHQVRSFGGNAQLTDVNAQSGTDRIVEVAQAMPDVDIFVNVQGDEPDVAGESIDRLIGLLTENPEAQMATLATPIRTKERLDDPSCVKVVFNRSGEALYFSRSPIPHVRDWDDRWLTNEPAVFYQHIGLYAYRRDFLLQFAELQSSELEQLEKLEQLRVLDAGYRIVVDVISESAAGIDTPEDYARFVSEYRRDQIDRAA